MAKQIIGWVLVSAGVITICWGLYDSWQMFRGLKEPPQMFKETTAPANASGSSSNLKINVPGVDTTQIEKQMQDALNQQLGGIVPKGSIVKVLNLSVWSLFVFILIAAGSGIASIGAKLLRNGCKNDKSIN